MPSVFPFTSHWAWHRTGASYSGDSAIPHSWLWLGDSSGTLQNLSHTAWQPRMLLLALLLSLSSIPSSLPPFLSLFPLSPTGDSDYKSEGSPSTGLSRRKKRLRLRTITKQEHQIQKGAKHWKKNANFVWKIQYSWDFLTCTLWSSIVLFWIMYERRCCLFDALGLLSILIWCCLDLCKFWQFHVYF